MRFQGKVVIVTGSSRGIGKATARLFLDEGAFVVVTSRSLRECKATAAELGKNALPVKCDVSKSREVAELVRATLRRFKKIDIVVNNAGVFQNVFCKEMSENEWDRVVDIDLKGPFLLSKAVIPHLKEGSCIVNVASVLGMVGDARAAAYCAAKGGLIQLTKALALELVGQGVRVNAVAPGPIATDMLGNIKDPKIQQEFLDWVPMGRVGQPEEIAKVILFLASDDASFITGQCVVADGGGLLQ